MKNLKNASMRDQSHDEERDEMKEQLLMPTSSSYFEEITAKTLDSTVTQFVELQREIPDGGMRNFEQEYLSDESAIIHAQRMFAMYVLGKITPSFDMWFRQTRWTTNDPS